MNTAFVAGATGYTGREVVRELCERDGVAAVAHVRPDSGALGDWRERFKGLGADVDTTAWDEGAMTAALRETRPTHVFALLGTLSARMAEARKDGLDPETLSYEAVDYGLTALLMRSCVAADISPRFVYLSSAGVRESAPGDYLRVRHRMETELLASGLPYTIARPSFISGPDRPEPRPFERLGAGLADTALFVAGAFGATKVRDRYHSTDAATLAGALVRLAFDEDSMNRIVESEDLR
jgi:uncharacterized protein YbjT (DUF2867 family)